MSADPVISQTVIDKFRAWRKQAQTEPPKSEPRPKTQTEPCTPEQEIKQIAAIAGRSELLVAVFISRGITPEQVRKELAAEVSDSQ